MLPPTYEKKTTNSYQQHWKNSQFQSSYQHLMAEQPIPTKPQQ
jgi:hypothetical protein